MTADNTRKPRKPRRPLNAATVRQRPGPKRKRRPPALVLQRPRWTEKQRRFVSEYLVDVNATQAAIRSGYSKRTARAIGYENLTKPHIAAEIAKGRAARSLRTEITSDNVVQQLQLLADAQLGNAAYWDTQNLKLTPSDQLQPAEAAAVRSVKMGKYGPEIRLSDPAVALRMLGEHTGAFEAGPQQAQMIQVNIVVDDKREVSSLKYEPALRLNSVLRPRVMRPKR